MDKKVIYSAVLAALLLSACGGGGATQVPPGPTATPPRATLQVMGHDSFNMSEGVLQQFETSNNVTVQILKAGDTGTALNKAILAKANPLADVFYGVDNTFLSRALDEGIFEPYDSPLLAVIPDRFKLDPQNRALPVDYGDVCLNYDIAYMQANDLTPPAALDDLLDPNFQDLLVVENPATSSPGLAFLFTTIAVYGEDGFLDYWRGLLDNGVLIVNDWETAYDSEFSGGPGEGTRPIVVSYASSPPFEVIYAEEPIDAPTTAAVVADDTCFRQIEFVGILTGTERRPLAEAWVDFMLSPTFQEDIPLQMFVFPVNPEAKLDETFVRYLKVPDKPVTLSPDLIAAKRETWIQEWTEAILR